MRADGRGGKERDVELDERSKRTDQREVVGCRSGKPSGKSLSFLDVGRGGRE